MAITYSKSGEVTDRCNNLAKLWERRNQNIAGWYDTLALYDELKQEHMESVVSNDPRTFYNSALHLLAPNIPHRIPVHGMDREAMAWTASIERAVTDTWSGIDRQYRRRGRKSWMEYMTGLLLATGWYAVLCMSTRDKLIAEVWNPIEVYQDWDSQGLSSVAHVFTITSSQAMRLFLQRGWEMPTNLKNVPVTIYDLWEVTSEGVINVTSANSVLVKPETVEPFEEIPILTGPAGGLPDDGAISAKRRTTSNQDWRGNIGQSILATNEGMYNQYNRALTFMQQILRDTAQPKYWEKSRGSGTILTPEDLEKRGAIFRLGEGDDVGTLQMPGIPVELTSLIGSYEQMIQRGALPNALSGQVQNIPIGLMSQVAAAAVQVLSLYHRAITGLLTDIDNTWVEGIIGKVFTEGSINVPEDLPASAVRFDIQYPINIPGDLIQRATVTRMISPGARIAASTALDLFFPEITDPVREMAQARADDAQSGPIFILLSQISALRDESRLLRQSGNTDDADLLMRAQEILMSQILGEQAPSGQAPAGNGNAPSGIPSKGISPNVQEMLQGLGVELEAQQ